MAVRTALIFVLFSSLWGLSACQSSHRAEDLSLLAPAAGESASTDLFSENENGKLEVSYHQAINRAMDHNLDVRMAALEVLAAENQISLASLNAFPSLQLTGGIRGRSDEAASSSESILSGQQSLEPSTSSEKIRRFHDLELRWNTLDLALAVIQLRDDTARAGIEASRFDKVRQTVIQDVTNAYLRALSSQNMQRRTEQLIQEAEKVLANSRKAAREGLVPQASSTALHDRLSSLLGQLYDIENEQALAMTELKSLLNLPLDAVLSLSAEGLPNPDYIAGYDINDINELETLAIIHRPELEEARQSINIAERQSWREIWRTLPGGTFMLTLSGDSNEFLVNDDWASFSTTLTQNILNLVSYPARQRSAENVEELEKARFDALAAAVAFQVRLAHQRLSFAQDRFALAQNEFKSLQALDRRQKEAAKAGLLSGAERVESALSAYLKQLEEAEALRDIHNAYVQMQMATGTLDETAFAAAYIQQGARP